MILRIVSRFVSSTAKTILGGRIPTFTIERNIYTIKQVINHCDIRAESIIQIIEVAGRYDTKQLWLFFRLRGWVSVTNVKSLTAASQRQSFVDKLKGLPPSSKKGGKLPKSMARP